MATFDSPPSYDDIISAKEKDVKEVHHQKSYEDKFVKVTKDGIEIKCYYFPTAQNKIIQFSAIRSIFYDSQKCLKQCCYIKSWGMAFSNIWWACDMRRQCPFGGRKAFNVVVDVDESPMKGFSVEDIEAFLAVLSLFSPDVLPTKGLPF